MALPADALQTIPDSQLALFLPNQKLVDDYKTNQAVIAENADSLVQVEQDAADALAAANTAVTLLNGSAFLLLGALPPSGLSQSRSLAFSSDFAVVDSGAHSNVTVSLNQRTVILPATATDSTGAFVNVPNFFAQLAANATYLVEGSIAFQSGNVAVGLGLCFTLPAAAMITGGYSHQATATGSQSAMNIASGTVNANTTAVPVATSNTPLTGRWIIKTAATAGPAQLQLRSGSAGTLVTLLQDLSMLSFRRIA